jgi:hypothetical protein
MEYIIKYTKINEQYYKISFNNKDLGNLSVLEDGDFHWFPCDFKGSAIATWVVMDIYLKLEQLNGNMTDI